MVTVLQILFALLIIILIIVFVFQPRRIKAIAWPDNYQDFLNDYVTFYANLDEEGKKKFENKFEKFCRFKIIFLSPLLCP